jgi:iron complex outermembrane receptor protein
MPLAIAFCGGLTLTVGAIEPPVPPVVLPPVIVHGTNDIPTLTAPSLSEAQAQKIEVPGGLTIKDTHDLERGRASGFQDLLRGGPGVVLQGESSTEAGEVSIRGSGVLSDQEPVGISFMLDGFTMNQGDGQAILEDFDLNGIQYAEVFRGANAFRYGSITLGGAINLVSRTGYNSSPLTLRVEGGSYGYLRGNASSGGVEGSVDYFSSVTGRHQDGFRAHSREDTEDLYANLGWRIAEHWENRFYLTLARTDRLLPGGITKEEMMDNPRQANEDAVEQNLSKEWQYLRLADKVTFKNEQQQFSAGAYWWHRNLIQRDLFNSDSPDGIQNYYSDNAGVLLDSITRGQVFGQNNVLTVGLAPTVEREVDQNFENIGGQRGATTGRDTELSINSPFYLEDQQYLTEKLSLSLGVQAIYSQRKFADLLIDTPSGDQSANQTYRGLNPKVGAIYEFDPKIHAFANFSRSWQPPSFDNMVEFGDAPGASLEFKPLHPQHAWTAETGIRGEKGRWDWELALYRSWVRNELLRINNEQGQDLGAVNVGRSIHQGIEAALGVELLDSVFTHRDGDRSNDKIKLEQTYTLNDLRFDGDAVYGNNRIAVIPIHLYEASLTYEHPAGFYAGPNARWNITKYPVDHANTLYADAYALFGFRTGYISKKGFSVFLEARNLADKRYASDVDPIPDARTSAGGDNEIFHPGDGRSFYGGISWAL